jgi:hypothetical protein
MSGVLLHDGRAGGHRKWSREAVQAGFASGVIVNPFSTPRVSQERNPSASTLATDMDDLAGDFIFDPMTHSRMLATTNKLDFYDQWELWPNPTPALTTAAEYLDHVERVFQRQSALSAPFLAPTVQLSSPLGAEVPTALELSRIARGITDTSWQSLVGTRSFWSSGADLDAYVGALVALRAPVWVITVANEIVVDSLPDMNDVAAFEGLCRTVRSLSLRSRVIVCYADYAGLPAVAAGADTVGTGWHRAHRTFDPSSFRLDSDGGIRRPAAYVTQGALHAVLRRDTADQIARWDADRAARIRGGTMPRTDGEERVHHLAQLSSVVALLNAEESSQRRFEVLRDRYAAAATDFDALIAAVPSVVNRDKAVWCNAMRAVLDAYAGGEGLDL